jgi:hypothetical protein
MLSENSNAPVIMTKKILPLAIAATLWSAPCFAAMPLITDDTGTQGKGKLQLELGWETHREKEIADGVSLKETGGETSATITCGLTDRIDLVAGAPWSWQGIEEDGITTASEHGIGDVSLQIKWRFFEMEGGKLSLAVKPGITLPSGNESRGLGNGRVSGGALLIATHTAEPGAVHVNLGYNRNSYGLDSSRIAYRKDIWHASLAGELNVMKQLRAVGDLGIETSQEKENDTNPVYLLGGLIYSLSDFVDIDFGIKGGLNDAEPDTAFLAGVTMHL